VEHQSFGSKDTELASPSLTLRSEVAMADTRSLKREYKRRQREYSRRRQELMEKSPRDALGNIIVHPSCVQSLMNARARIGQAYRRWKRKAINEHAH
jgi:hypothetical protein